MERHPKVSFLVSPSFSFRFVRVEIEKKTNANADLLVGFGFAVQDSDLHDVLVVWAVCLWEEVSSRERDGVEGRRGRKRRVR